MPEKTAPLPQEPSAAQPPVATAPETTAPETVPAARRTVTLPVLPLAIVGAVLIALIFFGGGVALGYGIADHPSRVGVIQPFTNRNGLPGGQNGYGQQNGQNNGQNGFGQNRRNGQNGGGQNGGSQNNGGQPNGRPTTAPNNG